MRTLYGAGWFWYYAVAVVLGITVVMLLSGCTSTPAGVMEAIGKDQASACVAVQSGFGVVAIGRVNAPGVKVDVTSGSCKMERAGE